MISPALQTLYADLTQQARGQAEKPGSIYRQRKGGETFLYARRTAGAVRLDTYLGPASAPAVQARADLIRREQALARQRRKTVSLLKRSGIPAPGPALSRVLDVLADAGLFKTAVLVGTAAYQCYSPIIGMELPSSSLMTQDADVATATLAIATDSGNRSMLDVLRMADESFRDIPGLSPGALPASFQSATGFRVDLLTPVLRRSDRNPMPLPNLKAGATPLQYLNWLIDDPMEAVALAGPGIVVRIPQPSRFAVHKLIVAQMRRPDERPKRRKDLVQAAAIIDALRHTDPHPLQSALRSARAHGKQGWADPIARSLEEIETIVPVIA